MSDDSDDEEMKFKRFIKFEKRKQVEKYGEANYHQSRTAEKFEVLILKYLGGRQIFKQIFKKELPFDLENVRIYTWVMPSSEVESFGNFLDVNI
mgnify:CR=1 FL=1